MIGSAVVHWRRTYSATVVVVAAAVVSVRTHHQTFHQVAAAAVAVAVAAVAVAVLVGTEMTPQIETSAVVALVVVVVVLPQRVILLQAVARIKNLAVGYSGHHQMELTKDF